MNYTRHHKLKAARLQGLIIIVITIIIIIIIIIIITIINIVNVVNPGVSVVRIV